MSDPDDPRAWIEKAQGDFLCIENNQSRGTSLRFMLTRYAVQFRYPGEEMAVEETEARESIGAARKIETAVASMLPRS